MMRRGLVGTDYLTDRRLQAKKGGRGERTREKATGES